MQGWIEIFKSGKHISSNGSSREWSRKDLDKMVSSYASAEHEAPVVIGHPKSNDPAFGWLASMKREGDTLLGKFKQVAPEFKEMVQDGRFKKRSISVYPDGTIRHVGFLGAQPPAIKGLRDITFGDDGAETYEFSEQEATMPTVEELQAKLDAEIEARKKSDAEAEKFKQKAEQSESNFAEHKVAAQKKEIVDFVEAGIAAGKILPAWKERGLVSFMQQLDSQEESYEFSEGKTETTVAWFKDLLNSFAKHPLFKEMVKPEGDKKREAAEFAEEEKEADEMAASHQV